MAEEIALAQADSSPQKVPAPKKGTKKAASATQNGEPAEKVKKASHPKFSDMIVEAIQALKERGGSSRQAIFKYVMTNYELGPETQAVSKRLKTGLMACLEGELIIQATGTGVNGSFKINPKAFPKKKAAAEPKEKKPKSEKAPKKKPEKKMEVVDEVDEEEDEMADDEPAIDAEEKVVETKKKAKASPKPKKSPVKAPRRAPKDPANESKSKPKHKDPAATSPRKPAAKTTQPKSPKAGAAGAKSPKSPKVAKPKAARTAKGKAKEETTDEVVAEETKTKSPPKKTTKAKKPAAPKAAAAKKS